VKLLSGCRLGLVLTLTLLLVCPTHPRAREQDKANGPEKASAKKEDKDKEKDKDKEEEEPKLSVTEHTITVGGKPVKYKATAGYIVLKDYSPKPDKKDDKDDSDEDDSKGDKKPQKKPKALAKVFFIAYTRADAGDPAKRPVTFTFNGGPGSASVWLHMGALGPRRAILTERGEALPPPYRLEDNNFSWLDDSDLVFIDPVSTGYSRPEIGEDPKKFHGY
jgi:carboxypeptidase C (cathepsin A)